MFTNPDMKSSGSRQKKILKLFRRLAPLTFLIHVQAFRDPLRGGFRMSKSSWMMDPTRSRETPSCSAIDLAEIRRSSKISSWVWSIITGVITVLGRPARGASQVEKSPRLNWATQVWRWHTMVRVPQMFVSEWREFPSAPCLGEKNWWQLASRCCWNRARRLTCFLPAFVTKRPKIRQTNRPIFPMALSIPSYNIGN